MAISRKQFLDLKVGDLLLWRGKYLRTVLEAPKHYNGGVVFAIRRISWTHRATTTYGYNDLKHFVTITKRNIGGLMLKSEAEVSASLGFDLRSELKRELDDHIRRQERMGMELCPNVGRYIRMSRKYEQAV